MKSKTLYAHCSICHESFPDSKVKFLPSGADVCPKCKAENFTCALDGHYECACGVKEYTPTKD
jgi:Zn finger protein HypA/HybF involved in hydrogenase expression